MDVEGIVEEEEEVTGVALPMVNGAPAWHTLNIDPPDALAATDVDGRPSLRRQRRRHAARVPQHVRELRRLHSMAVRSSSGALRCPGCGRSFFLPQAGRSMDDDHLQLQPIPLLREGEAIKVAL